MKKTLGGYGAFRRVVSSGAHVDGAVLRCFYRVIDGVPGNYRVGFTVRDRSGGAVRRNYLKRIMRECFRQSAGELPEKLKERGKELEIVVMCKPTIHMYAPSRTRQFTVVLEEMQRGIQRIVSRLQPGQ